MGAEHSQQSPVVGETSATNALPSEVNYLLVGTIDNLATCIRDYEKGDTSALYRVAHNIGALQLTLPIIRRVTTLTVAADCPTVYDSLIGKIGVEKEWLDKIEATDLQDMVEDLRTLHDITAPGSLVKRFTPKRTPKAKKSKPKDIPAPKEEKGDE